MAVDVLALARAVRDNVRHGRTVSGASTITMQTARLLHPSARRVGGKVLQALWAIRLEAHLNKQQIMEQYLNRVQLGQSAMGVGAAANIYFARSASELSIGQSAMLAGIAHSPSGDNPVTSPVLAKARRALVLRRIRQLGLASAEDVRRAATEPLRSSGISARFLAPHFTTHVIPLAAADSDKAATVMTSLDLSLQQAVESEVRTTVETLRDRGVEQAAVVVLDNQTGEILSWVGSPDFFSGDDGQTDMVTSRRQPGSSLKPFLYALAFDRGFTAATVLPDVPRSYRTSAGPYAPRNYDRRFRGPVRVREALASSYNVPAVEMASRIGAGSLLQVLQRAGFASLDRSADFYGLGLALGDGDVTLLELANGYRALAEGGEWRPVTWRLAGRGSVGGGRRVASPMASAIVLDILADASARIPGFGLETPFDFPFRVAVKTGTSRHFTDNWAVGTTERFTVAVWAGNFSGKPMAGVSGVTGAGPLLHRVVMETARRYPPGALTAPSDVGAVPARICRLSGLRATERCASLTEWFAPGTTPAEGDTWETAAGVQMPEEYQGWIRQNAAATGVQVSLQQAAPDTRFRVTSPHDGDRYAIPAGVAARYASIRLEASGARGPVDWLIDGKPFRGERWTPVPGTHVIVALSSGESSSAHFEVLP